MKLNDKLQNLLYTGILVVVALIVLALRPEIPYTSHGIYLSQTQQSFPATKPQSVQVVEQPPAGAKMVGIIRTTIHYNSTTEKALDQNNTQNITLAKQLAAQHGAEFLTGFAGRTTQAGALDGQVFYGKAYRM